MDTTINVSREKVFHIVEGLSATIAQHNGGVPTMEQLWASESERKKLDIWWRNAVIDLEEAYKRWIVSSTPMFDLTEECQDYSITLTVSGQWSTRLSGLLSNHIQYYFVYAVLAGWLGDLTDVKSPDYPTLAAEELTKSLGVLTMKDINADAAEAGRGDDVEKDFSGGIGAGGTARRDRDDLKPYRIPREYVMEGTPHLISLP